MVVRISELPEFSDANAADADLFPLTNTSSGVTEQLRVDQLMADVFIPPDGANYMHNQLNAELALGKRVAISGSYNAGEPIVIPDNASLVGTPGSAISFYPTGGTTADDYLIHCTGSQRNAFALQNITLVCRNVGRGIWLDQVRYSPLFQNVRMSNPLGVGVDMVDCWGSFAAGLFVSSAAGIALRLWRSNSSLLANVNISGTTDADWPDPTEQQIQDGASNWVQTAANRRAALVVGDNNDLVMFNTLTFESNVLGALPLASLDAAVLQMNNIRFEANGCTDAAMSIIGDGLRVGSVFHMSSARFIQGTTGTPTLIDLAGTTRQVTVSDLFSDIPDLTTSILRASSGTHYNASVIASRTGNVPYVDRLQESGGVFANDTPVNIGTLADADAPNGTMFFSSGTGELSFRKPDGTLSRIPDTP